MSAPVYAAGQCLLLISYKFVAQYDLWWVILRLLYMCLIHNIYSKVLLFFFYLCFYFPPQWWPSTTTPETRRTSSRSRRAPSSTWSRRTMTAGTRAWWTAPRASSRATTSSPSCTTPTEQSPPSLSGGWGRGAGCLMGKGEGGGRGSQGLKVKDFDQNRAWSPPGRREESF